LYNNKRNKLKNKAFTLIELLGVIVIIGIISLIATPIVLNIVESARKNAFKNSAYGIVNIIEYTKLIKVIGGISTIPCIADKDIININLLNLSIDDSEKFELLEKYKKDLSRIIAYLIKYKGLNLCEIKEDICNNDY